MLQLEAKKNDSEVIACVRAQHVCEDIRIECEELCFFYFSYLLFIHRVFYEDGIEAKKIEQNEIQRLYLHVALRMDIDLFRIKIAERSCVHFIDR